MHQSYDDITSRITDPPKWWDEHGVPRFCDFSPGAVADIYADEAVLAEVTCQCCGRAFLVALSLNALDRYWPQHGGKLTAEAVAADPNVGTLAAQIRDRSLHYGDPPNMGCCAAGPTMNSEPRRVIEYWRRSLTRFGWQRDPALEVDIDPDWVREGG